MTILQQDPMTDRMPLVLDVDGTLLRTDMLHETFWAAMGRDSPAALRALARGWRAPNLLKADLCGIAVPNVALLPLRPEVVALAEAARRDGRTVHLASGSDHRLVEAVARRLDLPGEHFGSDRSRNLAETTKAQVLIDRFGSGGFDYAGNSAADLPAWGAARRAIAVEPGPGLRRRLDAMGKPLQILGDRSGAGALWRELRPQQWVKNLLLFLPLLVAHEFGAAALLATLLAVAAFCAGASAIYILNDLLDLEADRLHPEKRDRPIASGALPIGEAMAASGALALLALMLAWGAGPPVAGLTLLYMVVSLGYSLWLKKRRWVDLASLAAMFLLRVLTGAAAAQVTVPGVLLGFVFSVFLTLACVKRMTALARATDGGQLPGRGYSRADFKRLEWVAAAGIALSAALFLVYAFSGHSAALYDSPLLLAGAVLPLAAWLFRIVRLSEQGREHYDPVQFVTHDRTGLLIAALGVGLAILAV